MVGPYRLLCRQFDSLPVNMLFSNDVARESILSPATAVLLDQYAMMLLVLDFDHLLLDCKSSSPNPHDLLRPGTHEFLTTVYVFFDLAIWSQSSCALLNHKLATLGLLDTTHRAYQIAFALNGTAMFPVTPRSRSPSLERAESPTWQRRMRVKALGFIWARFPESWTRATTVHVDGMSRNFALNPRYRFLVDSWFWSADAAVEDVELQSPAAPDARRGARRGRDGAGSSGMATASRLTGGRNNAHTVKTSLMERDDSDAVET
ncbi:hypothetical protein AMAG_19782 [Allomyces macrogynus ATCC 38327]|uniref:FCP1 homology domain-containing protein n=1 Tax=Allomyces macrogynus (strain ATCC 38327) TaxID=578462 RepID=A0A0L0T0W9_ALLM3|nr:hypothetical protein AMAG_19782 [Allomyces macrogynus ATCC 38327]|eukprot:KNE68224.1 hypothetical protein AMAG_19782 [Allomyces macrogynus ATCC 38327]